MIKTNEKTVDDKIELSKVFKVIDYVKSHYPEDVFVGDGVSGKSAKMAQIVCENIKIELKKEYEQV